MRRNDDAPIEPWTGWNGFAGNHPQTLYTCAVPLERLVGNGRNEVPFRSFLTNRGCRGAKGYGTHHNEVFHDRT
jgi:hypothetical protein